jgi:hypothetical protein
MDSTLIIDYAETLAGGRRSLMPADPAPRKHALRLVGLALAASEKSVQIVYERMLRPPEKQHEPWLARVTGQMLAAYGALEAEIARRPPAATSDTIDQAALTSAVTWHFTQQMLPGIVPPADHPVLTALSAAAEALPEFRAAPYGSGTYPVAD